MFLQACLNGSRPPGDHERLPLTPDELARDAVEVAEAGAVALHVHPRGPDGLESLEPEHCAAAVRALREAAPQLELSLSTGLWITGGDVERRLECIRGWTELPDVVSLNVIEEGWEDVAALVRERGIHIEIGLWLADHPARLAAARLARRCRRALIEPQETAPAMAVATAQAIDGGLDAGVDRSREARIGLEDTYWLPDARRAGSNADLVAAAAERYLRPSG
jgi:uncharacterized protein (DUF849 family)